MVRTLKLINGKGQEFSLMDINNYCLLTEPSGLGFSYNTEYAQLGNTFINNLSSLNQGIITGQVNFLTYDNYKKFVDFIESSDTLKFCYDVPSEGGYREYLRDIELSEITKTEIQPNKVMSETVSFKCLSLWYSTAMATYEVGDESNEVRWDFTWDSYFAGYNARDLSIVNTGHTDASIEVEIDGAVTNPTIQLYIDDELYQEVKATTTIAQYEKFLYSSKEGDFYIAKEGTTGIISSLLDLSVIDFSKDLVIRIPKNKSCRLILSATENITKATIKIFVYYKGV